MAGGSGTSGSAAPSPVFVTSRVTTTAAAEAPPAAVTTSAPASAGDTIPGDGTFLVPGDIRPGTYRSGKPESGNCYWARLKSAEDEMGSIIANSNSSGPSVVTIKKTDGAFKSSGCSDWTRVH